MTRSIEALPRADFSPRAWGTCAPSLWGVKEGNLYDQIYRGSASSGLQSAYKNAPTGRTNSALIITQGFNPGYRAGREAETGGGREAETGAGREAETGAGPWPPPATKNRKPL